MIATALVDRPAQPLAEEDYSVPGLHCPACIAKLERNLPHEPGIAAARVNFTARRVRVSHVPGLSPPDIVAAIERLGFAAHRLDAGIGDGAHGESRALLKAVAVAGFAAMNIMLLSVSIWSGAAGVTRDLFHWLSALIALPTVAYAGQPFFRSAWSALRRGRTNMDVPISIGVTLATALSLFETATHGAHAYFDGAVMLLFFLLTGRWLDSVMRDRARDGAAALLSQTPAGVLVEEADGSSRWCEASTLRPGARMLVAAGERLAADGIVATGRTTIDRSLLTGESAPIAAGPGDAVHAGTLNVGAPVTVVVSAAGEDTAIADIARMMENAGQARSRYVRLADRAARFYAPAVHLTAALSFIGWMIAGAGWHEALLIAVAVLIITCPCALGLAVPAAQVVVAGSLMRAGILAKDGSALERLAEADRVMLDKTGTLTLGRPQPLNMRDVPSADRPLLLALARQSRHPLCLALRQALETAGIAAAEGLADVAETAGEGIRAQQAGRTVSLGRPSVTAGGTGLACVFAVGTAPPVLLRFTDPLRPGAVGLKQGLEDLGLEATIISGDRIEAVRPIAQAVGMTAVAGLMPGGKREMIARIERSGTHVLMIGDGLNDGPALAEAHVSMAPASASTVGQNAADIVWLGDAATPVPVAIRAARRTMRIVRQNLVFAVAYNVVAVPLAITGHVTPLIAAIAMSTSSIAVVANALRLRRAAA